MSLVELETSPRWYEPDQVQRVRKIQTLFPLSPDSLDTPSLKIMIFLEQL